MKNLQAKLKEIFEPRPEEFWMGNQEEEKPKRFEIKAFVDKKYGFFILDGGTKEMWRTTNYETMVEFVSERLGAWNLLNYL